MYRSSREPCNVLAAPELILDLLSGFDRKVLVGFAVAIYVFHSDVDLSMAASRLHMYRHVFDSYVMSSSCDLRLHE